MGKRETHETRRLVIFFVGVIVLASIYLIFRSPEKESINKPPTPQDQGGTNQKSERLLQDYVDFEKLSQSFGAGKLKFADFGPVEGKPIVLFHGQAFSSINWVNLGILDGLMENGYRAIAIDMPYNAFKQSESSPLELADAIDLLATLIKSEWLDLAWHPVLLAPSLSGKLLWPLVLDHSEELSGIVTVAPVGSSQYESEFLGMKHIPPFLNIWGSLDPSISKKKDLNAMTRGKDHVIQGGEHPAYVNHEAEFVRVVSDWAAGLTWTPYYV